MYQFEATVYEDHDAYNCHGAVWVGEKKRGEPLMTAHVSAVPLPGAGSPSHEQIMSLISLVCREIAQNLDDALF